jgi:hypothetical protein
VYTPNECDNLNNSKRNCYKRLASFVNGKEVIEVTEL